MKATVQGAEFKNLEGNLRGLKQPRQWNAAVPGELGWPRPLSHSSGAGTLCRYRLAGSAHRALAS